MYHTDRGRKSRGRSSDNSQRGRKYDAGMTLVNQKWENAIFLNEELRKCSDSHGQVMIVDSGCPRSLMGAQELKQLKNIVEVTEFRVRDEGFRFGPSRIYNSNQKAKLKMQVGINKLEWDFFIVDGNVPILVGNDIMDPLGGIIDMEERKLVLPRADMEIPIVKTNGGHFVIPVKSVAGNDANNVKGDEADAVMIMMLEEKEDIEDIKEIHDLVGHSTFVALALTEDEETQVKKVHRYFGHRSSRRIWELFAKAKQLGGKKKAVMEVIENCKTCSDFKKSPPRPKVGLPVTDNFNQVVGLDLKVVDKTKGEYILWMVDLFTKMIKGKYIKNKFPETIQPFKPI